MTKPKLSFSVPRKLKNRLEEVQDRTGLTKSEIARRGTLNEIKELEGDNK